MKIYKKEVLKSYVEKKLNPIIKQYKNKSRFCKKELLDFLNNDTDLKICGLYGLRRTGKSVLMYQTIQDIGFTNCVYINCSNADNYLELENEIEVLEEKYIFIDEVTKIEDFINLSSSLAEDYPDKKIVIAGTDSASILFSKGSELYDRIHLIHTTYISYAEYNYLLGKSLEEYIRYGGTLTDGKTIYNDEDSLEEYTNTAIISNICKSVKNGRNNIEYKRLYDLLISDSLESAINKTIEIRAREFSLKVMTSIFNKSHIFGSAKDLILKERKELNKKDIETIVNWKNKEICDYIISRVKIEKADNVEERDTELITNFLVKLDVLTRLPNGEIIFTQPGMQYCLAEILIEGIVNTSEYMSLFPNTQQKLLEKIHQDAVGNILENVIRVDMIKSPSLTKMRINKLDFNGDGEFDLYIINPDNGKAIVYEIKRSSKIVENQYKHLINEDFCNDFQISHQCQIIEKTVIYNGNTQILENGVRYYNVEELLKDIDTFTKSLYESENKNILDTSHQSTVTKSSSTIKDTDSFNK